MTTLAKLNQCSEVAPVPVTKTDVLLSFAHLTIKLGKNDFDGVRSQLKLCQTVFEQWLIDRPEKKAKELIEN